MPLLSVVLMAGGYLSVGTLWLARARPGYSHVRHTISELGERGSPRARRVAWGLFLPVALALAFVAIRARVDAPPAALLALCIAIGYLGAALFPCDPGAPLHGTGAHTLHSAAGLIEYAGGVAALFALSAQGAPFAAAAIVVLLGALGTGLPGFARVRGLAQRVAELTLFAALAAALRV